MRKAKYTVKELKQAVAQSLSFNEVARKLNLKPNSGSAGFIKKKIISLGIDSSNFIGHKASAINNPSTFKKKHWSTKLINAGKELGSTAIRTALIESGRAYACEGCGNTGVWNNKSITLQVDHKNGTKTDNRPENIRFLCPNCHSQTHNWCSKNRKVKKKEKSCLSCSKIIARASVRCVVCSNRFKSRNFNPSAKPHKTKITWPSIEELRERLKTTSMLQLGKQLGVSDNAIRKHIKKNS